MSSPGQAPGLSLIVFIFTMNKVQAWRTLGHGAVGAALWDVAWRPESDPGSGSCCGLAKTDKKASALSNRLWYHGRRGGCQFLCRSAWDGVVGKGLYRSGIAREEDFRWRKKRHVMAKFLYVLRIGRVKGSEMEKNSIWDLPESYK